MQFSISIIFLRSRDLSNERDGSIKFPLEDFNQL